MISLGFLLSVFIHTAQPIGDAYDAPVPDQSGVLLFGQYDHLLIDDAPQARIILAQADVWEELIRLDVGDLADRDTRPVGNDLRMQGVRVCAEENKVRIRRAEVMLDNNRWQRLFLPLALDAGECSDEIEILGGPRRLRAVQFDYEAWSDGYDRATLVVQGHPELEK